MPATTETATMAMPDPQPRVPPSGRRRPGRNRGLRTTGPERLTPGHHESAAGSITSPAHPQGADWLPPRPGAPEDGGPWTHGRRSHHPHPRRRGGGAEHLRRAGLRPGPARRAARDARSAAAVSGESRPASSRSSSTRPTPMPPSTSRSTPSRSPTPRSPPTDPPRRGVDSCPPKCVFLRAEAAIPARRSAIRRVFARRSACSCAPKLSILAESRRRGVPQDAERRLKHPQIPHTRHAIPHTSARDSSRLGAHLTPRA